MIEEDIRAHIDAVPGYCNTASVGIPPRAAVEVLRGCLDDWAAGTVDLRRFDAEVVRAREAFATLAGTHVDNVAMPGSASITAGVVASSLPDGARVLCAREDFTSVLFPFLVDDRLDVTAVPVDALLDHITPTVDVVAVSAVQSADGRVLDLDALAGAADAAGARTYLDATQAVGWLAVGADRFDVTSCAAYKWLCSPRGIGFATVRDDVDWLVPRLAGWYAGADPWASLYGPPLRLADDARRFTVSPAWFDVASATASLEALVAIGVERIHAHDVGLANRFRGALDLPEDDSPIVSLATHSDATAVLAAAGITTANRAGRTRVSFHLSNTTDDADQVASVLRAHTVA
ncbi:MAG TPA: aminotransferase class V-fold PLP-dependent enzyme [Euzebyales bacterium]